MQTWTQGSKELDRGSEDASRLMVSLYVQQKSSPPRGLSRASRRILLTTSIWSVVIIIAVFFITYTVLLVSVDTPFQRHHKHDTFHGASHAYRRPKLKLHGRGVVFQNDTLRDFSQELGHRQIVWDPGRFDMSDSVGPECKKGSIFIIVVTSSPSHFDHRIAIRNSWCNADNFSDEGAWQCVFLIGQTNDSSINSKLKVEGLSHRDIIRGSYIDSYRNLTCKVMHGFSWLKRHCNVPFVLKTDDDCFINALLFRRFLLHHNAQTSDLYAGNMLTKMNKRHVIRGEHLKWSVSVDDYSPDYYPVYASGSGYAMSFDVVSKLVDKSRFIKPIPNEDAYVGIVMDRARVKPTMSGRFTLSSVGLSLCNYVYVFVAHGVQPSMQQQLQRTAVTAQSQCHDDGETNGWF